MGKQLVNFCIASFLKSKLRKTDYKGGWHNFIFGIMHFSITSLENLGIIRPIPFHDFTLFVVLSLFTGGSPNTGIKYLPALGNRPWKERGQHIMQNHKMGQAWELLHLQSILNKIYEQIHTYHLLIDYQCQITVVPFYAYAKILCLKLLKGPSTWNFQFLGDIQTQWEYVVVCTSRSGHLKSCTSILSSEAS